MIRQGATLVCSECGRVLYRTTLDCTTGDLVAADVVPLAGQDTPKRGEKPVCPDHGETTTYLLPPVGDAFPERPDGRAVRYGLYVKDGAASDAWIVTP